MENTKIMAKKKKNDVIEGPNVISLDNDELGQICRRVRDHLADRAEKAREKKEKNKTKKSYSEYVEASKDVFMFIHLLELVDNMTEEISDLRAAISNITSINDDDSPFIKQKKRYLN